MVILQTTVTTVLTQPIAIPKPSLNAQRATSLEQLATGSCSTGATVTSERDGGWLMCGVSLLTRFFEENQIHLHGCLTDDTQ